MTWIAPEPTFLGDGPDTGELRPIIQGYLDQNRRTLLSICAGLNEEQLARRSIAPSSLSLLGLVRHMTRVERTWLRIRAAGEDASPLFPTKDEDFDDLDPASAPAALEELSAEWTRCDAAVAETPLERVIEVKGHEVSLFSIYVHLIEEWARHNGHADLLRQSIDGVTGR